MYKRYDNSNRDEYYEQFTFPSGILQFKQWFTNIHLFDNDTERQPGSNKIVLLNAKQSIRFRNIEFGSTKKEVYETKGKPRFLRLGGMSGEKKHEIAFYKELQKEQRLICQFHFLDDLFFYGCQTFHYLPREKFPMIKEMLIDKYELENQFPMADKQKSPSLPGDTRKMEIITDKYNNQLRIVDNVFLNLVYLSGEERFKFLIDEFSKNYSLQKKRSHRNFLAELYSLL